MTDRHADKNARFGAVLCLLAGAWIAWYWINASAEPGITAADSPQTPPQPQQQSPQQSARPSGIDGLQSTRNNNSGGMQANSATAATIQPQPTSRPQLPNPNPSITAEPTPPADHAASTNTHTKTADNPPQTIRYQTQHNDTLSGIAIRFHGPGADWRIIYNANRDTITNPNRLQVGTWLNIPPPPQSP